MKPCLAGWGEFLALRFLTPTCLGIFWCLWRDVEDGTQHLLICARCHSATQSLWHFLKDTQNIGHRPEIAPYSHTHFSVNCLPPSAPLTNGLPVRKNFLIQMRREKVVARTLLISKKPKESKQRMKKKKIQKRKRKSQKRKKPRRRSQKPKGSKTRSS